MMICMRVSKVCVCVFSAILRARVKWFFSVNEIISIHTHMHTRLHACKEHSAWHIAHQHETILLLKQQTHTFGYE